MPTSRSPAPSSKKAGPPLSPPQVIAGAAVMAKSLAPIWVTRAVPLRRGSGGLAAVVAEADHFDELAGEVGQRRQIERHRRHRRVGGEDHEREIVLARLELRMDARVGDAHVVAVAGVPVGRKGDREDLRRVDAVETVRRGEHQPRRDQRAGAGHRSVGESLAAGERRGLHRADPWVAGLGAAAGDRLAHRSSHHRVAGGEDEHDGGAGAASHGSKELQLVVGAGHPASSSRSFRRSWRRAKAKSSDAVVQLHLP